eukprot:m.297973 g.297973  ORF g.297973 m.297973 type:complete len:600 (-) comp20090_c0_seq2:254-2053(-)
MLFQQRAFVVLQSHLIAKLRCSALSTHLQQRVFVSTKTYARMGYEPWLLATTIESGHNLKTNAPRGIRKQRIFLGGILTMASAAQTSANGYIATSPSIATSNVWIAAVAAIATCTIGQTLQIHCDDDVGEEVGNAHTVNTASGVAKQQHDWLSTASNVPVSSEKKYDGSDDSDAANMAPKQSEVQLSDDVALVILAGKKALMHGDLPLAEQKFREAVDQLALLDPNSTAIVVLLTRIGNLCYAQHKWTAAVDALSAAVRGLVLQVGRDRSDASIVELSLKISDCLAHIPGRFGDATNGYLWCVATARQHVSKYGLEFAPQSTKNDSDSETRTVLDGTDALVNDLAMLGMTLQAAVDHLQLQRDQPADESSDAAASVSPAAVVDLCIELLAVSERVERELSFKTQAATGNRQERTTAVASLPASTFAEVQDAMRVAIPHNSGGRDKGYTSTERNASSNVRNVASPRMAGAHARLAAALDAAGDHARAVVHAHTALDMALHVLATHGRRAASVHVYLVNLALLLMQGMPTMHSGASEIARATKEREGGSDGSTTVIARAVTTLLDAARSEAHTVGDTDAVMYIENLSKEISARHVFDSHSD